MDQTTEHRTQAEMDDWEERSKDVDAQRARWIAQHTCEHCGQHPPVPENLQPKES